MNPYLSRDEKRNFVQLEALSISQEAVLAIYQDTKSADSDFLKYLRTANTWLKKAIAHRKKFLNEDAKIDFIKQVSRLNLIFVPSDEAKKEYAEMKELSENFVMPIADFEDWYCEVIEHSCKTCTRTDWEKCKMHCLMTKYGVFPADPEAKTKCPYSYVGMEDALPARVEDDVEKKEEILEATHSDLETVEKPGVEKVEPVIATRIASKGMIAADIHLKNGNKIEIDLPKYLAQNIVEGFKDIDRNRPIVAAHIENEIFVIDTQSIAVLRAYGIGEYKSKQENVNSFSHSRVMGNVNAKPIEPVSYKIECKCGAEYFCKLSANKPKARCRDCGAAVYTDKSVTETFPPTGEDAILMTNRYFVPKEEGKLTREEAEPRKKESSQYKDPCQIF